MSARQRSSSRRRASRGPRRVGDVVDLPAERIDLEHRVALRARQDAHRRVERAAGGALGRSRVWRCLTDVNAHACLAVCGRPRRCGRRGGSRPMIRPRRPKPATARLAEMHALAQRIARAQQRRPGGAASVWMTATSKASRASSMLAENGRAVAQAARRCGAASSCRQASSAGEARVARRAPRPSAPAPAKASSGM